MPKQNDIEINIEERYGSECLFDSRTKKEIISRRPKGFVEVFEILENGEKKLVEKSNLIVYVGREALAQLLVDQDNTNVTSGKDERLYWLGLGSGGVDPSTPLIADPPTNQDTDLATEIPISATDSTCGDYHGGSYYKCPFDSVEFLEDENNSDAWLVINITTTITTEYANGYEISEAGLFTAEQDTGGYSGNFTLFARVTFPSVAKTSDRRLIFVWYLYL